MSSLTDEHLIKSILTGNKQHGKLLYERYARQVSIHMYKMVHDHELTRDLTQDTFVKVFNGLKGFKGESSVKTWLFKIARNLCLDHLSRLETRKKPIHDSINDVDTGTETILSLEKQNPDSNPLHSLLGKEKKEVVETAVDKLSVKHKEVILLWLEGFSTPEIAEIVGVSQGTVCTRRFHALKKLKTYLKSFFG